MVIISNLILNEKIFKFAVNRLYSMKLRSNLIKIFILLLLPIFFVKAVDNPMTDDAIREAFKKNYRIYALPIPDSLTFAGEPVPLERPDVKEKLDKELLINVYWQSYGLLKFKRAAKYFPVIEPILKKYGIPEDFKYLAVAESNLENVTSPAGARGIWQLMPEIAKKNNMEVSKQVDERYHLEKSTEAACRYLLEAKEKFGSWTLAAAAYNRGMKGLENALTDQQADSYWNLYLNPETARYVYRILAIKEIMEHPQDYGFHFRDEDLYQPDKFKLITLDTNQIDWVELAKQNGISYYELRRLNPWIIDYEYNTKEKRRFDIKIPLKQ